MKYFHSSKVKTMVNQKQSYFRLKVQIVCGLFVFVCSGSVVVTAYDFESDRPGSNPEWGII